MRVNIYDKEVTETVALDPSSKEIDGVTFKGIRFFTDPIEDSKRSVSSGVTFWFSDGDSKEKLKKAFAAALELLESGI